MSVYEIPLSPVAQTLSVSIAGTTYNLRVVYADAYDGMGGWIVDIADANGVSLVCGVPLVTGVDLLAQYAYLGIPGQWFVATDGDLAAVPTYANLGSTAHLYVEV